MSETDDVLAAIDDALADPTVGPDAVRFGAPEETREARMPDQATLDRVFAEGQRAIYTEMMRRAFMRAADPEET